MKRLLANAVVIAAASLACAGPAIAKSRLPDTSTLTASLSGWSEVPGPGDQDGGGSFTATLTRASSQLCYELQATAIQQATAAHIHVGLPGKADVAVATLATPGADGKSSGCLDIDSRLMRHLLMVPGNYYVNVHNAEFPAGAVRGQFARQQ